MAVDVFEGFRRLKLAVQGLIVLAAAVSLYMSEPIIYLKLDTSAPDDGWQMSERPCESGKDASEYIYDLPEDFPKKVDSLELCFRASPLFRDDGDLIPYARKGGYLFADERYSDNVQSYIGKRSNYLNLSAKLKSEISNWASEEYWRRWRNNAQTNIIVSLSLILLIELSGRLIGWISRGFMARS